MTSATTPAEARPSVWAETIGRELVEKYPAVYAAIALIQAGQDEVTALTALVRHLAMRLEIYQAKELKGLLEQPPPRVLVMSAEEMAALRKPETRGKR